jgi:hypothetical protein
MKKSIVIILIVFTIGCATAPTKEEIADLDYGSCPVDYEEKIKPEFESGILTAYEGEPIIWEPIQYWYKGGLADGSRLYAGYLVAVMAHQTRGNPYSLGTRLYGFIFNNDEIVKKLLPVDMERLNIPEKVGPLPFDERSWELGHSTEKGNQVVFEWVLPGETVQDWSELVTWQSFRAAAKVTPEQLAGTLEESFRKGCARVEWNQVSSNGIELVFERETTGCAPLIDEYSIEKIFRGPTAMHRIAYTTRQPFSESQRAKITGLVERAALLSDCG